MRINVSELRAISAQLFSHLEESGRDSVEIPSDYYWDISKENRYNPYEEPTNFDLGQLTDDWAELQKIALGEKEPIGYALVWFSTVLRAVGEDVAE